jgi:hypothetical protein
MEVPLFGGTGGFPEPVRIIPKVSGAPTLDQTLQRRSRAERGGVGPEIREKNFCTIGKIYIP